MSDSFFDYHKAIEASERVQGHLTARSSAMTQDLPDSESYIDDWKKKSTITETKEDVPPLPWYTILIVVGVGFGLVWKASNCNASLPPALSIADEPSNRGRFIAERALHHLRQLVSTKARASGSHENEVFAVDFLTREIGFIKQTALPMHKILLDVQKSKGCTYLGVKYGYTNCFADITNVVVQLSTDETIKSSKSLLLNCHFDSAPKSPGASAGSQCAVMLELLHVLSRTAEPMHNTVTFLFNGAKESYQQGALSFVTKHPWANNVKAVINLDAFGVGGREMLFQQGLAHPWLLDVYSQSAPHPHGLVLMEEAFYYLMMDTTDYNIFTDFGKIPGLGFARFSGGHVYRTEHDRSGVVSAESLQHTGDNVLALTRRVVSSNNFLGAEDRPAGTPVYFDLFGLYMVSYSECTAVAVNLATVCFAAVTFTKQMTFLYKRYGDTPLRMYLRRCLVGSIACHVTGILLVYTLARIAVIANKPMTWYSRNWMVYLIYFSPVIICQMTYALFINRTRCAAIPLLVGAQIAVLSQHLLVAAVLLLSTFANLRSSYLPMLLVLFPSAAMYLMSLLYYNQSRDKWIVGFLIGLALPMAIAVYHMVVFFDAMIPVYGRLMQPTAVPDVGIAVMSAIWCSLLTSHLAALFLLMKNAINVWCGFIYMRIILFVLLTFTPLLPPFALDPVVPKLQKMNVYHTERTFFNAVGRVGRTDSGYWVLPSDQYSANSLVTLMPNLVPLVNANNDCQKTFYCGMPISEPQYLDDIPWSYWVKAQPPVIHNPTVIQLEQRKMTSLNVRRLKFVVKGADHLVLLLSTSANNRLVKWSLTDVVPPPVEYGDYYYQVPAMIVAYTRGMAEAPFKFWMEFQIADGNLTDSSVDIVVVGHYMHSDQTNSQPFNKFLQQFPPWIHITSWISTYKAMSF